MGMVINPFGVFGTSWTPTNLASPPQMWFNDTSSVTDAGGGALSQWGDIGLGASNATQGTASNRPTIVASGLNGRRVITADGTNDSLDIARVTLGTNVGSLWCFAVFKRTALDGLAVTRLLFQVQTNLNNVARFNFYAGVGLGTNDRWGIAVRRLDADSAVNLLDSSLTDTNYHMFLATMDYTNRTGTLYLDGTQTVQNTTLTTAGNTSGTNSFGNHRIFTDGTGATPSNVSLAELISSRALPNASEIDKLFGYAAHRWGLTGNLPALHPYKTVPPTT
jgi:hypothetical protein